MESTQPASAPSHVTCVQGVPVVEIRGRLDTASAPAFDAQTASLFGDGCRRVLLDLSLVTYISSAGLRSILKMIKLSAARGSRVGVFSIPPQIFEVIEISGLQTL